MQFFNLALTVLAAIAMPVNVLALPAPEALVARTGGGGGGGGSTPPPPTCSASSKAVCCTGVAGIPILGTICSLIPILSSCSVANTKCCSAAPSTGPAIIGVNALNCVQLL